MKKLFWLVLFLMTSLANAAQFDSIIDAMAIRTNQTHTNNRWDDVSKIRGIKWKWPYYESGAHDHQMIGITKVGKSKNPNIGATELIVTGARTFISSVKLRIENESVELTEFGKGTFTKIKTTCDDDSNSNTVGFYRFEKQGFRPLYISYQSSWGAGGAGGVVYQLTYSLEESLSIYPKPCLSIRK